LFSLLLSYFDAPASFKAIAMPPAFHLATLSTAPAFEFTVLELMHDTSGRFSLSG
jgi:hypothetical protein